MEIVRMAKPNKERTNQNARIYLKTILPHDITLQLHKTTVTYSESKFSDNHALHRSEQPQWKNSDCVPLMKTARQRNLDQIKNNNPLNDLISCINYTCAEYIMHNSLSRVQKTMKQNIITKLVPF